MPWEILNPMSEYPRRLEAGLWSIRNQISRVLVDCSKQWEIPNPCEHYPYRIVRIACILEGFFKLFQLFFKPLQLIEWIASHIYRYLQVYIKNKSIRSEPRSANTVYLKNSQDSRMIIHRLYTEFSAQSPNIF